jgi:hypothetical protein
MSHARGTCQNRRVLAVRFGRGFAHRHEAARILAAALVGSSLLAPAIAVARATSLVFVALDYDVAPATVECPDLDEFRATVERQLGYDPFRAAAERRVAIEITRKEVGWDGRIRWSDGAGQWVGERRLSSRRAECGGIAASVAFAVAVQIQLLAELAPPELAPPPVAAAPAAVEQKPPSPPTVTAAAAATAPTEPPRRLTLSMGVGPSVAVGLTPQATGLGRFFVSGAAGRFSLELAADAALPVTQRDADGTGFTLDRIAAAAAACGRAGVFGACVTGTFGRLQAHGFGVDQQASPVGYFSQVGARLTATRDVAGRYFIAGRVDGLVMVSSSTVTLNGSVVWTTPRVGGVVGVDFGAHFF